jgi:hypothetical protein
MDYAQKVRNFLVIFNVYQSINLVRPTFHNEMPRTASLSSTISIFLAPSFLILLPIKNSQVAGLRMLPLRSLLQKQTGL